MSNHSSRIEQRGALSSEQQLAGRTSGVRGTQGRKSATASKRKNRRLLAEHLEGRALMAADVNPWHNENFPIDVDNDVAISPRDALLVINALNSTGGGSLLGSSYRTPETDGRVDVDGDGYLAPQDALYVINELNGEGEPVVVQFGLTAVSLTTTTPITSVQVGDHFRLRATVKDLRTVSASGVFSAYLDIPFTANVRPVIRENQQIQITGAPDDGTFTLTFSGQTTAPITFDPANGLPTASAIKTALEGLSNIDPGEIDVVNGPNVGTSWIVKFGGKRYGDTNVANMTASGTFNGGTSPSIGVTELAGRVPVSGEADSIARSTTYGTSYQNAPSARLGEGSDPNVLDEIGAFAGTTPVGTSTLTVFFEEFEAIAPGTATFTSNGAEDSPSHDVLMFGSSGAVADADIIYPTLDLTISQLATAVNDTGAATEDQTTFTRIDVLANDTVASGTKQISGTNGFTQGANGTVQRFTNGTATNFADDQLEYRPNANFFGTDTFTYVLTDGAGNTSTGTVTVTVAGVNDAPTLTSPTTGTTNEDTAFTFTGANAISVADIDAGSGNVSVSLTSTNGVVAVAAGQVGLISSGTNSSASLTLTGTVTAVNTALGTVTYTPSANASGTGTVAVTVNDNGNTGSGGAKTASKTTTITISAQNDAPVNAVPGAQNVTEGTTLSFSTANSNAISISDVDAGTASVQVTLTVTNGKLVLGTTTGLSPLTGNNSASIAMTGTLANINAALNTLVYTPNVNFIGADTLTVSTNDNGNAGAGGARTDSDPITINVVPNIRPRAIGESATVDEDSTNNSIVVLTNDIANLNSQVFLLSVANGAHGTTSINDNGTPNDLTDDKVFYTPNPNYFGSDTFTYVINDTSESGADSTGTVTVTVREINDVPTATGDERATEEGTALTFSASSLTTNDNPGAGESTQTLTVTGVTSPTANGGTVTLSGSGQIVYTPAASFVGQDTFTYAVTDNGTTFGVSDPKTATGTVTVTVGPVNDPPVAGNDSASGVEDTAVTITYSSLLANDGPGGGADEANQTLSVTGVASTSSAGGTVTNDSVNQRFVFTPPADFNGQATITYTVTDNGTPNQSSTGTLTITFSEVNDAPTANVDMVTAVKNVARTYTAALLLGNDLKGPANESGQSLRITSVTTGAHGTAVLNGDGSVTYTPGDNYVGSDSFTYTIQDDGTTDGDPDFLSDTPTVVLVNVLDYIPMDVSGAVYFDADNDGVRDENEPGIQGVTVTLAGVDFEGNPVGPLTDVTDRSGAYSFTELAPGNYTITEGQPQNMTDGLESFVAPITLAGNDVLRLNVSVEDNVNLPSHNLTGNNFGERGVSSAFAGIQTTLEMLASSYRPTSELSQGLIFSFTDSDADQVGWYTYLDGWDGYLSANLDLAPDHLSAVLTVVNASNQTFHATVTAASARLRVRTDAAGNVMVHVVGDPSDFTLVAAAGGEQGEGEGADYDDAVLVAARARTDRSTQETIQAVDAVLASGEIWS